MTTSTILLGGTGYVAGELLRLLAGHPELRVDAVVSMSRAGDAIADVFPHLALAYPDTRLVDRDALDKIFVATDAVAIFSAGPHGASAGEIDRILSRAAAADCDAHLVDLSADFRFASPERYTSIYGVEHAAPQRIAEFTCAVPEHADVTTKHACHPGCFTTSVTLPSVALTELGLIEPHLRVSAVTGSTGAGREPRPTTHHPERANNLFAYGALTHRHAAEMSGLVAQATGVEPDVSFVPHSGPFARGIHATIFATLVEPKPADAIAAALADYYADHPFVAVSTELPKLKSVVGTNRCAIGVAASGTQLVVCSVIDNLIKGAAGGAIQWMNKLKGFDVRAGLTTPGLGWV